MKKLLEKMKEFTFKWVDVQGNYLSGSASENKNKLDIRGREVREFVNSLTDILNGDNGASYLGCSDNGTSSCVQDVLDKLLLSTGNVDELKAIFESLVINAGDSNAEIVQARYDTYLKKNYENLQKRLDELSQNLDSKVAKEEGKGLSEVNFTTDLKDKIEAAMPSTKGTADDKFTNLYIGECNERKINNDLYAYETQPNGYIVNRGYKTISLSNESNKTVEIKFDKVFPNECQTIIVTEGMANFTVGQMHCCVASRSTTGFQLKVQDIQGTSRTGNVLVYWEAKGK